MNRFFKIVTIENLKAPGKKPGRYKTGYCVAKICLEIPPPPSFWFNIHFYTLFEISQSSISTLAQ